MRVIVEFKGFWAHSFNHLSRKITCKEKPRVACNFVCFQDCFFSCLELNSPARDIHSAALFIPGNVKLESSSSQSSSSERIILFGLQSFEKILCAWFFRPFVRKKRSFRRLAQSFREIIVSLIFSSHSLTCYFFTLILGETL